MTTAPHSSIACLRDLSLLCRFRVSVMVTICAVFGFLLVQPRVTPGLCSLTAGSFLLAAACSAWNQAQERATDALMPRTALRPVAAGRMTPSRAMGIGLFLALPALTALYLAGAVPLLSMGLGIIIIYNGIYTPLKKHTGFALLIGAVAGALPLPMGWLAAGGIMHSPLLVLLYGVYLLWQIPHFWLRVEKRRHEYIQARLPTPPLLFADGRYHQLFRIWFHAFAAALLMLPVFPLLHSVALRIALTGTGIVVTLAGLAFFQRITHISAEANTMGTPGGSLLPRLPMVLVDGTMAAAMLIIFLDRLLPPAG